MKLNLSSFMKTASELNLEKVKTSNFVDYLFALSIRLHGAMLSG